MVAPPLVLAALGPGMAGGPLVAVAAGSAALVLIVQRFTSSSRSRRQAKAGDKVPAVSLDTTSPPGKLPLAEFCKGKRVVLVGLPAAFTPTCSEKQVPGYLAKARELEEQGVSDILVYCVNDAYVMSAWAAEKRIKGSIVRFLGDPRLELTAALGLVLDHPGPVSVLGNRRCKRFSMLIEDGTIRTINVAEAAGDPTGDVSPAVSFAEKMLADLQGRPWTRRERTA